jgi:hypothetical protein
MTKPIIVLISSAIVLRTTHRVRSGASWTLNRSSISPRSARRPGSPVSSDSPTARQAARALNIRRGAGFQPNATYFPTTAQSQLCGAGPLTRSRPPGRPFCGGPGSPPGGGLAVQGDRPTKSKWHLAFSRPWRHSCRHVVQRRRGRRRCRPEACSTVGARARTVAGRKQIDL